MENEVIGRSVVSQGPPSLAGGASWFSALRLARDQADYYLLNWVEFTLFVGCTAFMVEGVLRRLDSSWQFTLEELLVLTASS